MGRKNKRILKDALITLGIILAYFVTAKLSLRLAFFNPSATPVWAPTGIAISVLLLLGYRFWPGILVGAFLANAATNSPVVAIAIAIGNTLEGILGAYFIKRFADGKNVFDSTYGIFKFIILTCMVSTAVSATIGVTSLAIGGFQLWVSYPQTWFTWWLGDTVSALLIVPLIVLWSRDWKIKLSIYILEFTILLIVVFFAAEIIFGGMFSEIFRDYILPYQIVPIFIWVAFRFGRRETAAVNLFLFVLVAVGTLNGQGPFITSSKNESLVLMQMFTGIMSSTGLILSTLVWQTKKSEIQTRESLNEKEVLLKEVYHRVKNNMQIINSLLSLQARGIKDKNVLSVFRESQNRVKSMSLVHEGLYTSGEVGRVELESYAKKLCNTILDSYAVKKDDIMVEVKSDITLDMDTAIKYGLIINELVTNSLKYAFVKGKGKITISGFSSRNYLSLIVEDDGKGIPENFDWKNTKSLGLGLVKLMVEQLDGLIKIVRKNGTRFIIRFPKKASNHKTG